MIEKIRNKTTSMLVLIINILLLIVGFFIIRERDQNRLLAQQGEALNSSLIDPKILEVQNAIFQDRETKLNSQNTSPKETKTINNITKKTTTTSAPKATTKTKTS
jgi:hypothetical protein